MPNGSGLIEALFLGFSWRTEKKTLKYGRIIGISVDIRTQNLRECIHGLISRPTCPGPTAGKSEINRTLLLENKGIRGTEWIIIHARETEPGT